MLKPGARGALDDARRAGAGRLLVLAAALNLTAGAAVAAAQTVMVRNAPPGSTVEVVVNAKPVGTGTVGPSGDVSVPVGLEAALGKTEIDAYLFLDVCENTRRVVVVERGAQPLQPGGCERRDIPGLFLVRRVSTIVVNVGSALPTVLLRQGTFRIKPPRAWTASPAGLQLFGAGAFTKFGDAAIIACGTVEGCDGKGGGFGYTAGATYWVTRYVGAEASYIKSGQATASFKGNTFGFDNTFDADVVTIAGKVGVPVGLVRIYGQGGTNFHSAVSTTVQTIGTASQTLTYKTEGWGWGFGGGMEIWVASHVALFGEAGLAKLKGDADGDSEAVLDDNLSYVFVGARVRIGK